MFRNGTFNHILEKKYEEGQTIIDDMMSLKYKMQSRKLGTAICAEPC